MAKRYNVEYLIVSGVHSGYSVIKRDNKGRVVYQRNFFGDCWIDNSYQKAFQEAVDHCNEMNGDIQ